MAYADQTIDLVLMIADRSSSTLYPVRRASQFLFFVQGRLFSVSLFISRCSVVHTQDDTEILCNVLQDYYLRISSRFFGGSILCSNQLCLCVCRSLGLCLCFCFCFSCSLGLRSDKSVSKSVNLLLPSVLCHTTPAFSLQLRCFAFLCYPGMD